MLNREVLPACGQHALFIKQLNDLEEEMGLLTILKTLSISVNCLTINEL